MTETQREHERWCEAWRRFTSHASAHLPRHTAGTILTSVVEARAQLGFRLADCFADPCYEDAYFAALAAWEDLFRTQLATAIPSAWAGSSAQHQDLPKPQDGLYPQDLPLGPRPPDMLLERLAAVYDTPAEPLEVRSAAFHLIAIGAAVCWHAWQTTFNLN